MAISKEILVHFNCEKCTRWWSIADAPIEEKKEWFCPWCGEKQTFEDNKKFQNES